MPGVFELLKRGWDLYVNNLRSYYIYLALSLFAGVGSNVVISWYAPNLGTLIAKNWDQLISFSMILVPLLLILTVSGLGLIIAIATRVGNETVRHRAVFITALKRLPAILVAQLIAALPALIGLLFAGLYRINPNVSTIFGVPAWLFLALAVLFVGFGVVALVWFAFANFEILLAGKGVITGLKSSFALVHGRWWRIVWRLFATALIIAAAGFLIQKILEWATIDLFLMQALKATIPTQALGLLVISSLIGTAFMPWAYGINVVLYKALKN